MSSEPLSWSFSTNCPVFQVDIFLPRYKEPWSLYGPVVQSALDINYPPEKLTVYVLDDGRSDPVKQDLQVRWYHALCFSTCCVQPSIQLTLSCKQVCGLNATAEHFAKQLSELYNAVMHQWYHIKVFACFACFYNYMVQHLSSTCIPFCSACVWHTQAASTTTCLCNNE